MIKKLIQDYGSILPGNLDLSGQDYIFPGGRIHNLRHIMDFPGVFDPQFNTPGVITHPAFIGKTRVTNVILEQDIMLHFLTIPLPR